jgi:hypothetical protein
MVVRDTTIEALAERMAENEHGVVSIHIELGAWFGAFDRYGGKGQDRSLWLSLYDAKRLTVDRVKFEGDVMVIEIAACSLIGSITPEKLHRVLRQSEGFIRRSAWTGGMKVTLC